MPMRGTGKNSLQFLVLSTLKRLLNKMLNNNLDGLAHYVHIATRAIVNKHKMLLKTN